MECNVLLAVKIFVRKYWIKILKLKFWDWAQSWLEMFSEKLSLDLDSFANKASEEHCGLRGEVCLIMPWLEFYFVTLMFNQTGEFFISYNLCEYMYVVVFSRYKIVQDMHWHKDKEIYWGFSQVYIVRSKDNKHLFGLQFYLHFVMILCIIKTMSQSVRQQLELKMLMNKTVFALTAFILIRENLKLHLPFLEPSELELHCLQMTNIFVSSTEWVVRVNLYCHFNMFIVILGSSIGCFHQW